MRWSFVRETTRLYAVLINSLGTRQRVVPGRKRCFIEMIVLSAKPQSENVDSYKMLLSLVFVLMFREKFTVLIS